MAEGFTDRAAAEALLHLGGGRPRHHKEVPRSRKDKDTRPLARSRTDEDTRSLELEMKRLELQELILANERDRLSLESRKMDRAQKQQSKPVTSPPKYDGKTGLKEFLFQFDVCRKHNKWTDDEAAYQLLMACTGDALTALTINDVASEDHSLEELIDVLEQEFESKECAESHFLRLTRREQKPGEGLQELGKDIKKLVKLAYPTASKEERERTAKEYFKKAIGDCEVRKDVFRSRPTTLDEAISVALESESFYRMDAEKRRSNLPRNYTRNLNTDEYSDTTGSSERRYADFVCFHCGEPGHTRRRCPVKKKADTARQQRQGHQHQQQPFQRQQSRSQPREPVPSTQSQGNLSRPTQRAMGRRQKPTRPNQQ